MNNFSIKSPLLRCGNSSGVEHNLAKVGVASSNLVSRSTFLLFFFPIFLFSDITLQPMYCVQKNSITLADLGFYKSKDEEILNLNKNKAAKIKTSQMIEILKAKSVNYNDKSGGFMIFVANCDELEFMQNAFLQEITKQYPQIIFNKLPDILPQNNLPDNFRNYKFDRLSINQITSQNGIFRTIFRENGQQKTLFFKYNFQAKIPVLRATKNISIKQILGLGDYYIDMIDFDNFKSDFITNIPSSKLISKRSIKNGEYLSINFFNTQTLVKKGDKLVAFLDDGSLSVSIEVTATEHGNLGDKIKVISNDKKSFEATIVSKNRVLIR